MNVRELISELEEFDDEVEVLVSSPSSTEYETLGVEEYDEEGEEHVIIINFGDEK